MNNIHLEIAAMLSIIKVVLLPSVDQDFLRYLAVVDSLGHTKL